MKIANIVAVADVNGKFNLDYLNSKIDNSELTPTKNWLKMRLKPENNYIAFYSSGKFLITGVKTFEEIHKTIKKVMVILNECNIYTDIKEVIVNNIVLTDSIELNLPLDKIIISLNCYNASYEPEQFPGLFYKDNDGINYTLFSSGKMIITGLTDLDMAKKNIKEFKSLIKNL